MGKSSREFAAPSRKTTFSFFNNGQSHEGDESDGSHEGHACNEEEGSEQDRQGQTCKVGGLPWHQGQDLLWLDQERLDQEQEWQDCEQEALGTWQEGLRQHQGLDCCCPEGQEGFGRQGLRRSEEGNSSLQEGQGALPVSNMSIPRLQLRAWGCLRPWSAAALGGMMCGEHH